VFVPSVYKELGPLIICQDDFRLFYNHTTIILILSKRLK